MTISLRRAAAILGAFIVAAYLTSFTGGFHFDDSHSIENNLAIRSFSNIPSFWTDPKTSSFIPENRVYRPLVYTFYTFCWAIGKGQTWPFHLMKWGMHLLVCLALFSIWRRLWSLPGWFPSKNLKIHFPFFSQPFSITSEFAALLLALIFAIHPAGSECVDYIAATTSLQCAMFYVWAFEFYLRFREDTANRKNLIVSLLLYFLAVASKEEGITLPAMIVVTEIFYFRAFEKNAEKAERSFPAFLAGVVGSLGFIFLLSFLETQKFFDPPVYKIILAAFAGVGSLGWALLLAGSKERLIEAIKKALPHAALAVVMGFWILSMRPSEGDESRGWVSSYSYFLTQWRAYLWYMRLWFWPWDLNADVAAMEFSKSISDPLAMQAAIGNLALLIIAWTNRFRAPALLYGALWFYITISPASSVVVLAEAINEHRMYLAYIGFVGGAFTLLLAGAEWFFAGESRAKKMGWLYAFALFGLFMGVQERNRVWSNDENLWLDTVEKNPTSGRAMNNLGLVYMGRGDYQKAITYFEKCEHHWTSYMYCPLNKAIAFSALSGAAEAAGNKEEAKKKLEESESAYQRAYSLNPRSVHVNYQLGKFYEETKKDYQRAVMYLSAAVKMTGDRFPDADIHLANCYAQLKSFSEARASLERALSVEPNNQQAYFQLGKLELDNSRVEGALAAYEKLLRINPGHLQGWYNYGVALMGKSDYKNAMTAFQRTVDIDGRSEQGWYNLAFVAEKLGDGATAVKAVKRLIEMQPQNAGFQSRLTELEKKFGQQHT